MEVVIRKANREDMHKIKDLIQELADYENVSHCPKLTVEDLQRDGFDTSPPLFFCLVAECENSKNILGYTLCNFAYSSWYGKALYLEDFYVKPEMRGQKIGHKLFKETCKIAKETKCCRIDWHTLVDNALAIRFYESHGAKDILKSDNRMAFRILESEIIKVADSD